ncbi:MAG: LLM class flavin-dependent oxidoreductase [Betaproteobacteria bacterium]|nr:MAG: LLM class flavin-dependent oxidoreductase [Betaproteobacteria bacterium]
MRFGLFGGARIGKRDLLGDSYGYNDFIEYIRAADRLGFESAFLVEHHFTGQGQLSASLNLLSYLAACTKRIRLGTAVVVLPWHNPALLAEQVATLDVLSGGRVELGVGRGYRKAEFDAFCVPMDEAWDRFNECLDFLLKAWTTEGRFSFEGKYCRYNDVVVEPAPIQRPHPPIWMAAGSPESIERVAASNYNLLLDQLGDIELTLKRVGWYLDALEAKGLPRDPGRVGVARALHIVNNDAERRRAYERRRETITNIGELARKTKEELQALTDEQIRADDAPLIGTPDEIVERLQRLADGGIEYVLLTNATATPATLELFAREIMPRIVTRKTPVARAAAAR